MANITKQAQDNRAWLLFMQVGLEKSNVAVKFLLVTSCIDEPKKGKQQTRAFIGEHDDHLQN